MTTNTELNITGVLDFRGRSGTTGGIRIIKIVWARVMDASMTSSLAPGEGFSGQWLDVLCWKISVTFRSFSGEQAYWMQIIME